MVDRYDPATLPPHAIMFHHFHGGAHPRRQGSISADNLREIIERIGPRLLPARVWAEKALQGKLGRGDVCLTFDDSLRCQHDIAAPILKEYGLNAFFFVYTSVLEGKYELFELYRYFRDTAFDSIDDFYRAFDECWHASSAASAIESKLRTFDPREYLKEWEFYSDADRRFRYLRDKVLQLKEYEELMNQLSRSHGFDPGCHASQVWMDVAALQSLHAQGHIIGLHSHTHPMQMTVLPSACQREEYRLNLEAITMLLQELPFSMSHPCNSYDESTLNILRELGMRLGFRSNMLPGGGSELEFPREDHINVLRAVQGP